MVVFLIVILEHSNSLSQLAVITLSTDWQIIASNKYPKLLASYVMNVLSLEGANKQDPWASANSLNTGSGGPQPTLQNVSCTARDACKMHQNTP